MTVSWDASFAATPDGDNAAHGPERLPEFLHDLKVAIRERWEVEHETDSGRHRRGSTKPYEQWVTPTTRPGSSIPLDEEDYGRLWVRPEGSMVWARDSYGQDAWEGWPHFRWYQGVKGNVTQGDVFDEFDGYLSNGQSVSLRGTIIGKIGWSIHYISVVHAVHRNTYVTLSGMRYIFPDGDAPSGNDPEVGIFSEDCDSGNPGIFIQDAEIAVVGF